VKTTQGVTGVCRCSGWFLVLHESAGVVGR